MSQIPMLSIHSMGKKELTPLKFESTDAVAEGILTDAVIMEGGMVGGKTSVTFKIVVDLPEPAGRIIILTETSAAILEMLQGAIKGSEARWEDEANAKGQ